MAKTAHKKAKQPNPALPELTTEDAIREIRCLRNASPRGAVNNMLYVDKLLEEHDRLVNALQNAMKQFEADTAELSGLRSLANNLQERVHDLETEIGPLLRSGL